MQQTRPVRAKSRIVNIITRQEEEKIRCVPRLDFTTTDFASCMLKLKAEL
jgi:hypothetical protein